MSIRKNLVVGISGASGVVLGIEVLKAIRENPEWETHLVISRSAEKTIKSETQHQYEDIVALSDRFYSIDDIGANIASGTFKTDGMIIVPCSMKTLAGIACGYSDNLLLRAADVILKERRKLVLVPRECPLSPIHLKNMHYLSEMGVVIMPPMITFYNEPRSIGDLTRHITGKILDSFGIELNSFKRWDNS